MSTRYLKITFLSVALLMAALLTFNAADAKNPGQTGEESSSQGVVVEKVVKIVDKGRGFVEIHRQGRFKVDRKTVILSPSKTRMSLIYLDVPCWAEVRYFEGGGEPVLEKIQVFKTIPE